MDDILAAYCENMEEVILSGSSGIYNRLCVQTEKHEGFTSSVSIFHINNY